MDKNLITIAEYARIRNCSTTAAYKRLGTTLKPYIITVNKKTYLSRQVLIDEGLITVLNPDNKDPEGNQPLNQPVNNGLEPATGPESPALLETIKILEKQLDAREAEIERLHQENEELKKQLNEAARHNQEHTDKLTELLAQAQELNRNNQILIAQARQPAQLVENNPEEKIEEQPKKSSWFHRWLYGE